MDPHAVHAFTTAVLLSSLERSKSHVTKWVPAVLVGSGVGVARLAVGDAVVVKARDGVPLVVTVGRGEWERAAVSVIGSLACAVADGGWVS